MKTRFIMNPHSGRGRRETRLAQARKYFEKKIGSFDLVMTKDREDISIQTRNALHDGYDQIVALGGDGTVNGIVNGFFENGSPINRDASLVIAKWGTGSDYLKTVMAGSFVSDWKTLVTEHRVRAIDLGEVTFKDKTKYFINMASVGLSAHVADMKNKGPQWVPQKVSYFIPAVSSLIRHSAQAVKIEKDNESFNSDMLTIFISKGLYAGGGMKLGGAVSVDDGMFDVKVVEKMSLVNGLRKVPRLYSGHFDGVDEIKKFTAKEVRVSSHVKIPVELDGEVFGSTDVKIRVLPHALNLCWPRE